MALFNIPSIDDQESNLRENKNEAVAIGSDGTVMNEQQVNSTLDHNKEYVANLATKVHGNYM